MDGDNYQSNYAQYGNAHQDATFLKYRLGTNEDIRRLAIDLSGEEEFRSFDPSTGQVIIEKKTTGKQMVNPEGLRSIMGRFANLVSSQTVQGSMNDDDFWNFIANFREDFSLELFENMYKWGVEENYYNYIVNRVTDTLRLFISRTIGNEERKSYNTMVERSHTAQQQKKSFGL